MSENMTLRELYGIQHVTPEVCETCKHGNTSLRPYHCVKHHTSLLPTEWFFSWCKHYVNYQEEDKHD